MPLADCTRPIQMRGNKYVSGVFLYCSFRRAQGQTCIIEPLLQQWLEFAHVLKAQIQGLKTRDGSLTEVVSIQLPHGQADIPLMRRRRTEKDREI